MWAWSLNWGEVTRTMVVGTCPMTPRDLERIRDEANASAILSLQDDTCHAYWHIDFARLLSAASTLGLVMARHPIRDFDVEDMRRQLPMAIALLARLQAGGHRTYVHCTAGLGRAPLTVLGFLTLVEGLDPERAIQLIAAGRPGAVPAWEAYYGCIQDLVKRHRTAIACRAYQLYEHGIHGNADADWRQAQREVLRSELLRLQCLINRLKIDSTVSQTRLSTDERHSLITIQRVTAHLPANLQTLVEDSISLTGHLIQGDHEYRRTGSGTLTADGSHVRW